MSVAAAYTCDFCGKDRREDANHWYVVWISANGAVFMLAPWDLIACGHELHSHACGRACVLLAAERFMHTGSLAEPPGAPA
jgi:hypothetical protein